MKIYSRHPYFFPLLLILAGFTFGSLPIAFAENSDTKKDIFEDGLDEEETDEDEIYDPLETVNRGIFWFNEQVDYYAAEPVARGYDYITPAVVKTGVSNFFSNLRYPIYLISDLLQLKFGQAATHTGRFLINTTIGFGGFADVAQSLGLEHNKEDLGLTFGYWGIPHGPYFVIPFIGPSTTRDTFGLVFDTLLTPTTYPTYFSNATDAQTWGIGTGGTVFNFIQIRASLLDTIEDAKAASFDFYLFSQGAYYQRRRGELYDGNPPSNDFEDDEAFFDDDFEEVE